METVLGGLRSDLVNQDEAIDELEKYIAELAVKIVKQKGVLHNRKIFKKDLEETIAKLEPEEEGETTFNITVNGKMCTWNKSEINYEQLIKILGKDPEEIFSATYKRHDSSSGILLPKEGLSTVTEGMIFNIHKT